MLVCKKSCPTWCVFAESCCRLRLLLAHSRSLQLLMLGIDRIDWLLSMSSDKYDAIHNAGIDVMQVRLSVQASAMLRFAHFRFVCARQRVALPDMYVPKNATVEISAKISAGLSTLFSPGNRLVLTSAGSFSQVITLRASRAAMSSLSCASL
jgi:hypothetical protein